MILSACYMLWLYQRVFYGETGRAKSAHHITRSQSPRVGGHRPSDLMMVWMGVYSQSFLPLRGARNRTRLGADQRERPLPGATPIRAAERQRPWVCAPASRGGRPCSLTSLLNPQDALRFLPEIILTVDGHAADGARAANPASARPTPSATSAWSP